MKLLNGLPYTHIQVYIGFVVKPCNLLAKRYTVSGLYCSVIILLHETKIRKGIRWTERRKVSEISKGSKSRVENFTEREMIVEEGRQLGHIEDDMLESTDQNREIDEAYNHIHFQRVPIIQHSSDEYGSVTRPNRCHKSIH